jgi:hypothetical protein
MSSGGGAGQELQEIERGTFAGQQCPRRAMEMKQHGIRAGRGSLGRPPFEAHARVEAGENGFDIRNAADDRGLAGDHRGAAVRFLRDQGCRQVSGPDVLVKGALDLLWKVAGNRYRRH